MPRQLQNELQNWIPLHWHTLLLDNSLSRLSIQVIIIIIIIIIINEYYYGGAVALLLQDHVSQTK